MELNLFSLSGLLLSFTCFILLFIILRNAKYFAHYIWALFNFVVGVWGLACFFMMKQIGFSKAIFWIRLGHAGVIFISIFFLHLVYLICKIPDKKILIASYIQGFIFLALLPTDLFISSHNIILVFDSFYYDRAHGYIYPSFFSIWLGLVLYGHYLLLITYFRSKGFKRNQILYFFVGMIVGFSGGLSNFFPVFGINIYPFGNFTIILYCIIVTYAIAKYRLLDVTVAITRTGIFVATYSLILGIPFVLAYSFQAYFIGLFGDKWWLVPMGLLTVLATVGPFIFIYINKRAEDRLLREQRQYQNTLRQASSGMIRVRELKRLLNLIVHVVTKTVRLEFASIFLLDSSSNQYIMVAKRDSFGLPKSFNLAVNSPLVEQLHVKREPLVYEELQLQAQDNPYDSKIANLEKQLKEIKAAVVIPSYVGNKMLGFIVLGKKLSGKIFSQDDLNVFSVLANQMALAVENATSYGELKDTKSQLIQLEKLAATGKLAGMVAHEIKNPLTAIKTFTEYLDERYESKEFRDKFRYVVNSEIDRLQSIASQLLDVAKTARPQFKDNVDVHQIIKSTIFLLEKELFNQDIHLETKFKARNHLLKADPDQLKQCFLNLILNSMQALQNKDKDKRISILTDSFDTTTILVELTDTGEGIPEQELTHIFEPFFTTKDKGTGLGLSIVQGIILAQNGKIRCESQVNKGTTFIIELPLV